MRVIKLFLFFILFIPIIAFSAEFSKPYLVFKVNHDELMMDNTNIKGARLVIDGDKSYGLEILLTADAAKQLMEMTKKNIGKNMSVYFGGEKFISKATIQSVLGDDLLLAHFPKRDGQTLINSLKNNQLE
ncbi:MAG TPA: hypothetical protein VFF04_07135 [Candidatus Babeliales bacterium]|jgi:preprotein translocase subunit SecD|nr:hypothetical protein [Candidatus Babeliales bacterium]